MHAARLRTRRFGLGWQDGSRWATRPHQRLPTLVESVGSRCAARTVPTARLAGVFGDAQAELRPPVG